MLYPLVRPLLFKLEPEFSHQLTIKILSKLQNVPGFFPDPKYHDEPVTCFGLTFPNRIGLAAGLDKNAECVKAWQSMGFGFVEVGTVTPLAQLGNEKPRLFRLRQDKAIINRLGFNNAGIDALVEKLNQVKRFCPIGINIGKNRDTKLGEATRDYQICFERAYSAADYVVVNVSSPNTPGLRLLQDRDAIQFILQPLIENRKVLSQEHEKHVPILVKISPDLSSDEISVLIEELLELEIDGVIATNTTIERPAGLRENSQEVGGLSGAPLRAFSTHMVSEIFRRAGDALPIIAVGGIMSKQDAEEKFQAGAKLVQIYTGFIYEGPALINQLLSKI